MASSGKVCPHADLSSNQCKPELKPTEDNGEASGDEDKLNDGVPPCMSGSAARLSASNNEKPMNYHTYLKVTAQDERFYIKSRIE